MSWWPKKSDQPKPPESNAVPFRRADRPEVMNRLRRNAERPTRPVVPPREREENLQQSFVPADFKSVDEVLWKARTDIRRGLINPSACLIITYDQERRKVIWYQYGRENDEADAAFRDWFNEVVFDE